MDNKTLNIIAQTSYMTLIARHGLSDARRIIKLIDKKLKDEVKKRKEKK